VSEFERTEASLLGILRSCPPDRRQNSTGRPVLGSDRAVEGGFVHLGDVHQRAATDPAVFAAPHQHRVETLQMVGRLVVFFGVGVGIRVVVVWHKAMLVADH